MISKRRRRSLTPPSVWPSQQQTTRVRPSICPNHSLSAAPPSASVTDSRRGRAAISRRAPPFPVTFFFFFYSPRLLLVRNLVVKDTDKAQVVAEERRPFICLVLKRTKMSKCWNWTLLVLVGAVTTMLTESSFILNSSWSVSQLAADLKGNSLYASLLAELFTNSPQTMAPFFYFISLLFCSHLPNPAKQTLHSSLDCQCGGRLKCKSSRPWRWAVNKLVWILEGLRAEGLSNISTETCQRRKSSSGQVKPLCLVISRWLDRPGPVMSAVRGKRKLPLFVATYDRNTLNGFVYWTSADTSTSFIESLKESQTWKLLLVTAGKTVTFN